MNSISLKTIQDWTKDVLTKRGNLSQKVALASRKYGVDFNALIQHKKGIPNHKRLDIYASGYVLRLLECLQADYPCLKTFMGNEVFELFAKAYIVSLPSESYSLYHFTARFPEYLETTKPNRKDLTEEQVTMFELPSEIAAVERAKAEIAIAKGTEHIESIVPDMIGLLQHNYIFKTPECLRILKQNHNILTFMKALQEGEVIENPERNLTYIGITRKNYRLYTNTLEAWQYHFLKSCGTSKTFSEAITSIEKSTNLSAQELSAKLLIWIPIAITLGYLIVE